MGIYVYYGKVAATCQLGHWFSLFHQGWGDELLSDTVTTSFENGASL